MAEKATKSKKDNKNLIVGCLAALAVVIVIIITVVLVTNNSGLNDNYFVSDDTKYVITYEADESDEEDEYSPIKTHVVYTYKDDTITGMKTYYAYANEATAKTAYDTLKGIIDDDDEISSIELNGKYIVITASEDSYKDLTASDVKEQIEFMESLKNLDFDDSDEEVEDVEVDETTEEEAE